jgi:hypothetical protein
MIICIAFIQNELDVKDTTSLIRVVHLFRLLCVFTFLVPCCDVRYTFRLKRCSIRIYLQLFVGGLMHCVFVYVWVVVFNTY